MKKEKYKSNMFIIMIVFASLFMCIGYAAFDSVTLELDGSSNVLSPEQLFITNIITSESNSNTVVNLYDQTFLDASITLNGETATATMSITIKNNSSYDYSFVQVDYSFGPNTYDNQNIIFGLSGLSEGDIIKSTESLTFDIIFYYDDLTNITSNVLNCKLNFNFENISGMPLNQLILSNEVEPTNNEDGLYPYKDIYYYSGDNVNNYIWYNCQDGYNSGNENCEVWRILTIEADGSVKIIKDTPVEQQVIADLEKSNNFWHSHFVSQDQYKATNMIANGRVVFDSRRRRPVGQLEANTSYCIYSSNGCNAFAAVTTSGSYSNLIVDDDNLIKIYLENIYYNKVLTESARAALKVSEYNIGIIDINIGKDIDTLYAVEGSIKTNSKVALLNVSNYVFASKDINCKKNFLGNTCNNNNWLNTDVQFMFLNGKVTSTNAQIFLHNNNGLITSLDSGSDFFLKPVITLQPTIIAVGSGTNSGDYYKIVN